MDRALKSHALCLRPRKRRRSNQSSPWGYDSARRRTPKEFRQAKFNPEPNRAPLECGSLTTAFHTTTFSTPNEKFRNLTPSMSPRVKAHRNVGPMFRALILVVFVSSGYATPPAQAPGAATPADHASPAGEPASEETPGTEQAGPDLAAIEEKWGIRILSLRLSAGGHMLDFRYRVTDEEKALPIFDRDEKPVLIDQKRGAALSVPSPPKLGPLRTSDKPIANRTFFILFGNAGKRVQAGDKVSLVIGDFRVENITVE